MPLPHSDLNELLTLFSESRSSLHNKTILLTGSSGLIGGYLLKCLLSIADNIDLHFNLVITTRQQIYPEIDRRNNLKISYIYCDYGEIRSIEALAHKYKSSIDIIFHCASPSSPKAYIAEPFSTFAANSTCLQFLLSTLDHSESCKPPKFFSLVRLGSMASITF